MNRYKMNLSTSTELLIPLREPIDKDKLYKKVDNIFYFYRNLQDRFGTKNVEIKSGKINNSSQSNLMKN